jgi:hypothetical protein
MPIRVSFRVIFLALAATVVSANSTPTVSVNLKHSGSGNNGFAAVVEGFGLGVNLEHGASPFKSIFCRFSRKLGSSNADVDAGLTLSMVDNSVCGELTVRDESGNKLTLDVDSASAEVVNSVSYHRAGDGWSIHPTFHVKEQSTDLETSVDINPDTHVALGVKTGGTASLTLKRRVNAATSVKIQSAAITDLSTFKVEVSHRLDAAHTVTPTLDCGTKRLALAWVHTLSAGRTLTARLAPDTSIALHLKGASHEDWSASIKAPWGNLNDAELNFGRKFMF